MDATKSVALCLLLAAWSHPGMANTGEEIYKRNCAACHDGWGGYGAPGVGNYDAWRPAMRRGNDEMFVAVRDGRRSMAPRAGNPTLTDDDLHGAVQWVIKLVNDE